MFETFLGILNIVVLLTIVIQHFYFRKIINRFCYEKPQPVLVEDTSVPLGISKIDELMDLAHKHGLLSDIRSDKKDIVLPLNNNVPMEVITKIEAILNEKLPSISLYKTYYSINTCAGKGVTEHMFRIIDYTGKLWSYSSSVYLIQLFPVGDVSKRIDISYLVYLSEKIVKKGIWNADMLDTVSCRLKNKDNHET